MKSIFLFAGVFVLWTVMAETVALSPTMLLDTRSTHKVAGDRAISMDSRTHTIDQSVFMRLDTTVRRGIVLLLR